MNAMWLMLQQDKPDDYVIATGETHSVREFIEKSFGRLGMTLKWEGKGSDEKGINAENGKVIVSVDPKYYRPTEVEHLIGDPSKARKGLGWEPEVKFDRLVEIMTDADREALNKKIEKKNR